MFTKDLINSKRNVIYANEYINDIINIKNIYFRLCTSINNVRTNPQQYKNFTLREKELKCYLYTLKKKYQLILRPILNTINDNDDKELIINEINTGIKQFNKMDEYFEFDSTIKYFKVSPTIHKIFNSIKYDIKDLLKYLNKITNEITNMNIDNEQRARYIKSLQIKFGILSYQEGIKKLKGIISVINKKASELLLKKTYTLNNIDAFNKSLQNCIYYFQEYGFVYSGYTDLDEICDNVYCTFNTQYKETTKIHNHFSKLSFQDITEIITNIQNKLKNLYNKIK
jgi:hypothetical protein